MKRKLLKRFYNEVHIEKVEDEFCILLDRESIITPAGRKLVVPNEALAKLVSSEFSLQKIVINPEKMPVTRLVNTIIDGIADDHQPIMEDILRFAAADMLFYRAESPYELVLKQIEQWDPILDWAASKISARFIIGKGITHIEQPREAVAAVSLHLRQVKSPFALGALHSITVLTGSALIALSIASGEIDVSSGWKIAHLDEDWIIGQWGEDEEAKTRRSYHEGEVYAASAVLSAS